MSVRSRTTYSWLPRRKTSASGRADAPDGASGWAAWARAHGSFLRPEDSAPGLLVGSVGPCRLVAAGEAGVDWVCEDVVVAAPDGCKGPHAAAASASRTAVAANLAAPNAAIMVPNQLPVGWLRQWWTVSTPLKQS